jgi:transcriptional regulator with XRE-family HTH domain
VIITGKTLSERLKSARHQSGLSQKEVIEQAKIPGRTYQDMEYGKNINPTIETILPVAKALKVSLEELLGTMPSQTEASLVEAAKILQALSKLAPKKRAVLSHLITLDDTYLDNAGLKPQERLAVQALLKIS